MAKDTVQPYVFYLTRGKVVVFHPKQKNIVEIPIPDTIIKDLEVKKISDLDSLLANFIQQSKVSPGPIYLILSSDVVLERVFSNSSKENNKTALEETVKLAPFNHVGFQMTQAGKDVTLILVNRELYEAFQEILERLGFHVSAVTPAKAIGLPNGPFTIKMGKEILSRTPTVFQNSFIADPEQVSRSENNLSSDPRRNKKLLALLLAFGLLTFVLGGFVVKTVIFPDKPKSFDEKLPPVVLTASPTPVPASTLEIVATPSAVLTNIRIQVLNASGRTGLAQGVKDKLIAAGFKLVDTGNAETINGDKIQVVFSPQVPTQIREIVLSSLSPVYPNPATREGTTLGNYDVVITLTNSVQSGT